jgi:hypothetical protein
VPQLTNAVDRYTTLTEAHAGYPLAGRPSLTLAEGDSAWTTRRY